MATDVLTRTGQRAARREQTGRVKATGITEDLLRRAQDIGQARKDAAIDCRISRHRTRAELEIRDRDTPAHATRRAREQAPRGKGAGIDVDVDCIVVEL